MIKYSLNKTYFDKINTEEKAYFLGFLYADGCNTMNSVKIQVSETDKDILLKLRNRINSNCKILPCKPSIVKNGNKSYISKKSYVLWLNSRYLCNKLLERGCMPRKTFKLIFPKSRILPKKLIRHFIRGYFDGDGSMCADKNKKGSKFYLIGRKAFCLEIKSILEKYLKIELTFKKYGKQKYWTIHCGSIPNIKKILDYLYLDAKIYLNRKYKKYKYFVKFKYIPYVNYNFRFAN